LLWGWEGKGKKVNKKKDHKKKSGKKGGNGEVKVDSVSIRNANLMVVVSWVGIGGTGNDWAVITKVVRDMRVRPLFFWWWD